MLCLNLFGSYFLISLANGHSGPNLLDWLCRCVGLQYTTSIWNLQEMLRNQNDPRSPYGPTPSKKFISWTSWTSCWMASITKDGLDIPQQQHQELFLFAKLMNHFIAIFKLIPNYKKFVLVFRICNTLF